MAVRIQLRRDTLTNWSTNNPTLAEGEMGLEKDTGRWKVGNGINAWNSLPYSNSIFSGPSVITDSSTGSALRITQTGIGNALVVEDSVNPDSTPFVINNIGNVGIGTASPSVLLDVNGIGIFSGILYAPTASVDTSTTQVATTAFVLNQANSASATITMNGTKSAGSSKLYARADHVHPTDTSRAPLASPTFTGTPTAPTAAVDTNTTQVATTAFVVGQGYAKLASPALSGTPTAPTAAVNTNTTQIATTAFVLGQGNSTAATITALGAQAAGTSNLYARADHVHPTTGLGLTSGKLSQFATTTSAELAGIISDETGSGSLVFSASPAFTGAPTTPDPTIATGIANKRYVDTVSINVQTASYSLVLSDAGKLIEMNSSNPNTVTIPLDSSINFDIGTIIDVYQYGTGQTTIAGDVGVTIRSSGNKLNLTSQYSAATLVKRAANDWVIMGDLSS